MPVYVDDMKARYAGMAMSRMLADSDAEQHAMAAAIGLARRWHQKPGTACSHYDVCASKRALALEQGAIEITVRDAARLCRRRRT